MTNTLEELTKLPGEDILFDMDFGNRMLSGETISGITSQGFVNQGRVDASSDITLANAAYLDNIAQVRITAGTANEQYEIEIVVTTSLGNTKIGAGLLRIE